MHTPAGLWRPPFGAFWDYDVGLPNPPSVMNSKQSEADQSLHPTLFITCGEDPPEPHFEPQAEDNVEMTDSLILSSLPLSNSEADVFMDNPDPQGDSDLGPPLKRTRQQLIF